MINSINKTKVDVAEVGVGSGCIGLTILCDSTKPIHFIGGDISKEALEVSRQNLESFKSEFKFHHDVDYRKLDRLEGLESNSLDLIVSNPPYIKSEGDRSLVHAQVDQFEPSVALYIDDKEYDQWFLSFFQQAINCLRPDGIFLMEGHEHHLKNQMNIINEFDSISHCEIIKDLNSEDRFLKFRKKMDKLVVTGQNKLIGDIKVSKAKNATLPILFGVILNPNKVTINELPKLKDIQTTKKLLEMLGVTYTERVANKPHLMLQILSPKKQLTISSKQ